jgi:2'-5' RNA ligase
MSETRLYFIAIVVPEPIATEIRAFQTYAREQFNSGRALHSPPHITLIAPFQLDRSRITAVEDVLKETASCMAAFSLALGGFGRFGNKVIFIEVGRSESLEVLPASLGEALHTAGLPMKQEDRPYHPHVTIAFKDLSREDFPAAWDDFRKKAYRAAFKVEAITLLEHREGYWRVEKEFSLMR